jgi:hypothetical protein
VVAFPLGRLGLAPVPAASRRHRDGADTAKVDRELADLLDRYGKYWRKDAVADPASLRHGAVDLLCAMDLVAIDPHGRVRPRPAAARFAPEVAVVEIDDPDQQVLL